MEVIPIDRLHLDCEDDQDFLLVVPIKCVELLQDILAPVTVRL